MNLKIEYVPTESIKPYKNNAKLHPEEQIEEIKQSIEKVGFRDPIGIWRGVIVEGHGRWIAAKELGIENIPVIKLDDMTDAERRAYGLLHNKLAMDSGFDFGLTKMELGELEDLGFDMEPFDFESYLSEDSDWFNRENKNDRSREEGNDEYNEFLDKFETKKTTDDCYTPDIVYDAVAEWVAKEYRLKKEQFVRPFYPGGDYQAYSYPEGCVVVDNPPFSILAEILRWYNENRVRFFLFAPALTLFSSSSSAACALPCGCGITYENGACVSTSFVTNLEDYRVRVVPELYKAVEAADKENQARFKKQLPKYKYPDEVLTAAMAQYMCKYGVPLTIKRNDSYHIRYLESQKEFNDSVIYGSAYLLSEKAAAEKAAAEKAAAHVWKLSEKERKICQSLGRGEEEWQDHESR